MYYIARVFSVMKWLTHTCCQSIIWDTIINSLWVSVVPCQLIAYLVFLGLIKYISLGSKSIVPGYSQPSGSATGSSWTGSKTMLSRKSFLCLIPLPRPSLVKRVQTRKPVPYWVDAFPASSLLLGFSIFIF